MKLKNIITALIFLILSLHLSAADLRVNIIDVGQGDSILIETPGGKTVLIDAGDTAASSKVINFLKSRKVQQIDCMILTHPHDDHYGGMTAVINNFPVKNIWENDFFKSSNVTFEKLQTLIYDKHIPVTNVIAGKYSQIGSAIFYIVAPSIALTDTANNDSIVIRLSYGNRSFLLMGDCQKEERDTIINWRTCDVLKVAHHGSSNGTDKQFINTIHPIAAVISYGINNSYKHPDPATLNALKSATVAKTAIDGSITYITDGKNLAIYKQGIIITPGTGKTVYITGSGECYHTKTCRYAKISTSIAESDAIEQGYRPCLICKP